ncbi:hypothetical protein [Streptomyces sp. NBRC 110465]|uniref:hypothetical protein n=1 Tax=Streptomyces sp. NBRC 110465 TaxID=1897621 RepID=UPI0009A10657|nr:hypothetical protein [Streptomyces sp. NBRC 110465]
MNTVAPDATVLGGAQTGSDGRVKWVYEMRPIVTAADREVAVALVQDRGVWLAERGLDAPALHAVAFRDPRAEAVGLYEDDDEEEVLVGCLLLHRRSVLRHRGVDDSALTVSLAHTVPGRTDRVGWLMTMWLADYAARAGHDWVYAEAPGWHTGPDGTVGQLLSHLRDLGWQVLGSGRNPDGHRIARLRLTAAASPGLNAMIHCTVPLQPADTRSEPEEGTTR